MASDPEPKPVFVEACVNCKFFSKLKNEEKWICRRYPPQTNSTHPKGVTPFTKATDWCGEYRKKPEPKE
jgi:hypothetical protein